MFKDKILYFLRFTRKTLVDVNIFFRKISLRKFGDSGYQLGVSIEAYRSS